MTINSEERRLFLILLCGYTKLMALLPTKTLNKRYANNFLKEHTTPEKKCTWIKLQLWTLQYTEQNQTDKICISCL